LGSHIHASIDDEAGPLYTKERLLPIILT